MGLRRVVTMATAAAFFAAAAWGAGAGGAGGTAGGAGGTAGGMGGGGTGMGGTGMGTGTPGSGMGETMQKGMEGAGQEMKGMTEGAGRGMKGMTEGAGKGAEAVGEGVKGAAGKAKEGMSKLFGKEVGTYRGETGKQRFEKFSKTFKLSKEQREKLAPNFDQEAKELKGLYAKELPRSERDELERGILHKYYIKVKDVLSPEQLKSYVKMRGGEE